MITEKRVPFLDLKLQDQALSGEISSAIREVIDATAFAGGRFVSEFEKDFATFCSADFAIGVGSGTEAIWLVLLALGVGPGDEVITVPNTFIATAEAITFAGAKPVFVDIEPNTYNMNPAKLEEAITPSTKAIIPVHIFGQMADMDPILEVANRHGIPVVEDAAQAHGAMYKGRPAGSFGIASCFSFYPGKNLGAYGEAGGIVTGDAELDEKIRILRDHGQPEKYQHTVVGWNARMDGIQAAVLRVKLAHLSDANEKRRKNANRYEQALEGVDGIQLPFCADYAEHVYHIYAIRLSDRENVKQYLTEHGVDSGIHYPVPLHLQEAYEHLGYQEGEFPVSEICAREFLSLPMFPGLTEEQITRVAQSVRTASLVSP